VKVETSLGSGALLPAYTPAQTAQASPRPQLVPAKQKWRAFARRGASRLSQKRQPTHPSPRFCFTSVELQTVLLITISVDTRPGHSQPSTTLSYAIHSKTIMSSTGYPLIFAPAAHDISYINIKSPAATSSVPSPPLSPSAGRISALTRLQRITGSTRQRRKSSIPRSFSDITMSGYSSKMSPFEKLASSSSDLVGVQSLPPSRQSSVTAVPDENVPRSPWSKTSRTVLRKKASVASLILRLSDDDDDVLEIPNRGHSRHWRRDSTGAGTY